MIVRKLASGLLLTAVLAATGCFHSCDKRQANCCPPPAKPCCPPTGVVPPSGFSPQPAPVQYYYGPPATPR